MYDKDKIILMSKLAVYDEGEGIADMKKGRYFRRDYVYKQNMKTRFYTFLGSVVLICFYLIHITAVGGKDIFLMLSTGEYTGVLIGMIVFIVCVQVFYTVIGTVIHNAAYEKSKKRLDGYISLLTELAGLRGAETADETDDGDDEEADEEMETASGHVSGGAAQKNDNEFDDGVMRGLRGIAAKAASRRGYAKGYTK